MYAYYLEYKKILNILFKLRLFEYTGKFISLGGYSGITKKQRPQLNKNFKCIATYVRIK